MGGRANKKKKHNNYISKVSQVSSDLGSGRRSSCQQKLLLDLGAYDKLSAAKSLETDAFLGTSRTGLSKICILVYGISENHVFG